MAKCFIHVNLPTIMNFPMRKLLGRLVLFLFCFLVPSHCGDTQWNNPVIIKGHKLFDSITGEEFLVKGLAYYPRPNTGILNVNNFDFFTDDFSYIWKSDIEQFKLLGVNTIRIYAVDPSKNHDAFMCQLQQNGISVIVEMSAACKGCSIGNGTAPLCYGPEMYKRAQEVYNAFAVYDNTLLFSVGNENNVHGKANAPCVKALIRDVKEYSKECKGTLRNVPIGLVNADIDDPTIGLRSSWANFYNCVPEGVENSNADWFGLNPYVECESSSHKQFQESKGYVKLVQDFSKLNYSIPIVFGEFGCNTIEHAIDGYEQQRLWHEAKWLFEKPMNDIISGGCAFEYSSEMANIQAPYPFQEKDPQQFGLGYFSPEECDHIKSPCKYNPYPQFQLLADRYNTVRPSAYTKDNFNPAPERKNTSKCPRGFDYTVIPDTPKVKKLACSNLKPKCRKPTDEESAAAEPALLMYLGTLLCTILVFVQIMFG